MSGALRRRLDEAGVWFRARSPRERILICAMAVLLVGYGLFEFVWRPVSAIREDAAAEIVRLERAMAALRAVDPGAEAGPASPGSGLPPSTAVTRSAATLGLGIRRLEPDGGGLRVSLDEASADVILAWLALLETDHGLRVATIRMDRRPAPGLVTAEIGLKSDAGGGSDG